MRIRRSRPTKDFVQVPNATARDSRLSHMARGILLDILSRPDGWETTADDLWRESLKVHGKASPGRRAFRAAFAELKEHLYIAPERVALPGGRYGTELSVSDVPHGGTSARTGKTRKSAGGTDVPHAGTPEASTDVPHAGTPERPAETTIPAARTDVPLSDVPHAGTSKEENCDQNTVLKTTTTGAAEDLTAFGDFWLLFPRSRDKAGTLEAWRAAVASGVDPQRITAAAKGYAREKAGVEPRWIKLSVNWLREGRYDDVYPPEPDPSTGRPQLRAVSGGTNYSIEDYHSGFRSS